VPALPFWYRPGAPRSTHQGEAHMKKTERINIAEVDDGYQVQRIIQIKIPITDAVTKGAAHQVQASEARILPAFENRDIAIVLTGEEWFAMIAKLLGKPLSDEGRRLNKAAGVKLAEQLKIENARKADQ
jgi:formate-dependent phosphoribosylglycinamide formyltransferase (GAR transformylase)